MPRDDLNLAHLYKTTLIHARFLPEEARHRFSYSTLNVGVELSALEDRTLDSGRWFAYNRGALLSVRSKGYADVAPSKACSIEERLKRFLQARGVNTAQIARIYTTSMPCYLGFEGINPLVVHYCYSESDCGAMELCLVVLEVHNTFGERHCYLLKVGVEEGWLSNTHFHHQWTFPRAFHVSPFHNRSGFYQVSLLDPLRSADHPHTLASCTPNPKMHVRIFLLTSGRRERKMMASLEGVGQPLSKSAILAAVGQYPFTLLSTFARILFHAAILHYRKRLDVYLRPEPFSEGAIASANPIESGGQAGNVLWQKRHWTDRYIERVLVKQISQAARESRLGLSIDFDWADMKEQRIYSTGYPTGTTHCRHLQLKIYSPSFLVDLFIFPSIESALLVAKVEGHGSVSDSALLCDLLATQQLSWCNKLGQLLRNAHFRWLGGAPCSEPSLSDSPLSPLSPLSLLVLLYLIASNVLTFYVYKLSSARFVKGGSPWEVVERMEAAKS